MPFDFEEIKKHPYVVGGIVIAGALGLYILTRGSGGSGAAASTGIDPALAGIYQTEAAAQGQQQQLNAQLAATQVAANTQEYGQQLTAGVDLAQIQAAAGTTNLQTTTAGSVAEDQIAGQVTSANDALTATQTQTEAQLAGLENTNSSTVNIAGIQAGEQVDIAGIQGQTTQAEIAGLTTATVATVNANASIATAAIGASEFGGALGFLGRVL